MSLTFIHVVLSLALLYSQFCRSVKTDCNTRAGILAAFYLLTGAAILSLFAPLVLPGWRPSLDTVALLFAITIVQAATSKFWRSGVPGSFVNDHQNGPEVG